MLTIDSHIVKYQKLSKVHSMLQRKFKVDVSAHYRYIGNLLFRSHNIIKHNLGWDCPPCSALYPWRSTFWPASWYNSEIFSWWWRAIKVRGWNSPLQCVMIMVWEVGLLHAPFTVPIIKHTMRHEVQCSLVTAVWTVSPVFFRLFYVTGRP